jgi:hypothetical protein
MKYMLVLQFPEAFVDYDKLIELEEALIDALDGVADVDGHDRGSGEANIFIITEMPKEVFAGAKKVVEAADVPAFKAAYREVSGESYTVLWPPGTDRFEVA